MRLWFVGLAVMGLRVMGSEFLCFEIVVCVCGLRKGKFKVCRF